LCDVVGNFVHRSLTMTVKNFDGKVPPMGALDAEDQALLDSLPELAAGVGEALEQFRFRQACERFIDIGRKANQYFDTKAPWTTRKTDLARTGSTLYCCCQVVRTLCTVMAPFAPDGAETLARTIGITLPEGGPEGGGDAWSAAAETLPEGHALQPPVVLFPKLDPDRIAELAALHKEGNAF